MVFVVFWLLLCRMFVVVVCGVIACVVMLRCVFVVVFGDGVVMVVVVLMMVHGYLWLLLGVL